MGMNGNCRCCHVKPATCDYFCNDCYYHPENCKEHEKRKD